jgi:hypothetical protein
MKFNFLKQLVLGCALIVSANASASIISSTDTHTTSDGSVVNLSGLDWLSWDSTTGQSRNAIESGYGGYFTDGWRYATVAEYANLMTSVFDTYNGYSTDNADGAQWLYDNLYGHIESSSTNNTQYFNYYGDADNECGTTAEGCYGHFRMYSGVDGDISESISHGWIKPADFNGQHHIDKNHTNSYFASALVRTQVSVPEPTSLAIFALGMIGLASRRFKKQS